MSRATVVDCDLCKQSGIKPVLVLEAVASAKDHVPDPYCRLDVCSDCASTLTQWLALDVPIEALRNAVCPRPEPRKGPRHVHRSTHSSTG